MTRQECEIKVVIFLLVCRHLHQVNSVTGQNPNTGPAIDEEHQKKYPECGIMGHWLTKAAETTSSAEKTASSRIMNGKEAKVHYPWIVQVLHYWKGRHTGSCGGTIISKRYMGEL